MSTSQRALRLVVLLAAIAAARAESGARFNLLEPLFATDEHSDAHTVSAGPQKLARALERAHDQLPPTVDDLPARGRPSAAPSPLAPSTKAELLRRLASASGEPRANSNAKRQIESFTNAQTQDKSTVAAVTPRKRLTTEPPRHWSPLQNYYEKLKHSAADSVRYGLPLSPDENAALEVIVQEAEHAGDASYRYRPIYLGPGVSSFSGQQQQPLKSVISSAPVAQPAPPFLFPQEPGLARSTYSAANPNSGIPAGSGLLAAPRQRPEAPTFEYAPTKSVIQQRPIQIADAQGPQPQRPLLELPPQTLAQGAAQPQQQPPLGWPWPGAAQANSSLQLDQLSLRKLANILYAQQQNRAKHQQEAYGSLFDERGAREQQQQDANCGLLNQVPAHAAPSEFPSHAGLFNGTAAAEGEFLCGAVWVHERFALTLASCIKGLAPNVTLTVRTGEWISGRSWPNASAALVDEFRRAAMVSRQVSRFHLFPKFQVNSSEHNLALLEWQRPIEVPLDAPYIVPACQAQPRIALKANNCWAPVRNSTFVEYFDAEGEGETKLRRELKMVRVPVQLHANDDAECQRQTGVEFFNFQNPNYICSADFRPRASWRAKLNNAEYFGSGVYCNEAGTLSLVSILHPMVQGAPSTYGYLDLSYYRPWMRSVIFGRGY